MARGAKTSLSIGSAGKGKVFHTTDSISVVNNSVQVGACASPVATKLVQPSGHPAIDVFMATEQSCRSSSAANHLSSCNCRAMVRSKLGGQLAARNPDGVQTI